MSTPDQTQPLTSLEASRLLAQLADYDRVIIAVSGGADSVALLHLVADWADQPARASIKIRVVTIDHGIRAAAVQEAEAVARSAAARGLSHTTKTIVAQNIQTPSSDTQRATTAFTQAWGREHRYQLLAEAALDDLAPGHRAAIVTAHHQDDQAETVLMRLARGSGLQGLSAMRSVRSLVPDRLDLVRPFLSVPKSRLQATLSGRNITWTEDPSNTDPRFERSALRAHVAARLQLGLTTDRLALTSHRLARASAALETITDQAMRDGATVTLDPFGAFTVDWSKLLEHPPEIRLRILTRIVTALRGDASPVSLGQFETMTEARNWTSLAGQTFHHCAFFASKNNYLTIIPELGRANHPADPPVAGTPLRWGPFWLTLLSEPETGARLLPLGDADLRDLANPSHPPGLKRVLVTLPALKSPTGTLLSVPTLGLAPERMAASLAIDQACRPVPPTPIHRK